MPWNEQKWVHREKVNLPLGWLPVISTSAARNEEKWVQSKKPALSSPIAESEGLASRATDRRNFGAHEE
jgi:hypothetical protein